MSVRIELTEDAAIWLELHLSDFIDDTDPATASTQEAIEVHNRLRARNHRGSIAGPKVKERIVYANDYDGQDVHIDYWVHDDSRYVAQAEIIFQDHALRFVVHRPATAKKLARMLTVITERLEDWVEYVASCNEG